MRTLTRASLIVPMAVGALASVSVSLLKLPAQAAMAMDWPESVSEYVLQIRKTVKTTDMEGYLAVVKSPNGALLLDVREDAEFKMGHVPGAVNIPRGLLEFRIWKQLGFPSSVDRSRKIYVQCQTGGRATLATKQLQDIGFTNVIAVIMNFEEWQKKGNPLSKD
ncbi:MAG: rhodanese-like domain-containing protein [Aestuariivirga sp.]